MLFCMEYLKFALRLIWKKFSIRFYIENKEIFLTTLYGKPKPHKKVIFKALLRLLEAISTPFEGEFTTGSRGPSTIAGLTKIEALEFINKDLFSKMPIE